MRALRRAIPMLLLAMAQIPAALAGASLPAVELEEAPVIDGDLSDACWQIASKVTDFRHPASGKPASEPTTAWIAYDSDYIYAAFDCKDSQPELIHAQQTKRGGDMETDDSVSLRIDPFSEYRWLAHFTVNAAGTQSHNVQSTETGKSEWIGDWEAAAKRNPDGYSVEMRIPFALLKYDQKNPRISIAFKRFHSRTRQEFWCPDIGPNDDLSRLFLWEGVRPPGYRPRPVALLYALAGSEAEDPKRIGLDFKHSITPALTGLITVNPDFRNIEQEVDSVDFTYTERWLSDNRPFFAEGSQYFPGPRVFYPRRIGEIDAGAKIVGMAGEYKLAFLNARRFGHESYTVGQVGRQFGAKNDLTVWLGGAHGNIDGTDRLTGFTSINYRLRRPGERNLLLTYDYINSDCAASPGHGSWARYGVSTEFGPRKIQFSAQRLEVDEDYEPFLGVTEETGLTGWNTFVYMWDSPAGGKLSYWQAGIQGSFADHLDGSPYYDTIEPWVHLDWRNGTMLGLNYTDSDRPPHKDRYWTLEYGWRQKDIYEAGAMECSFGKLVGGDYLYVSFKQGFRLSDAFSVQLLSEYSRIDEPSPVAATNRQTVVSASYDISPEKGVVGRWIHRSGKDNFYLAYRQRVRTGMDAYLIFGDPNAEETKDSVLLKVITPLW